MDKKFTKDEILKKLTEILRDSFEIDGSLIKPEANLFEDLEFDSIDAVDLSVQLQCFTDKKIAPENFKQIRTVDDIVEAVYQLL